MNINEIMFKDDAAKVVLTRHRPFGKALLHLPLAAFGLMALSLMGGGAEASQLAWGSYLVAFFGMAICSAVGIILFFVQLVKLIIRRNITTAVRLSLPDLITSVMTVFMIATVITTTETGDTALNELMKDNGFIDFALVACLYLLIDSAISIYSSYAVGDILFKSSRWIDTIVSIAFTAVYFLLLILLLCVRYDIPDWVALPFTKAQALTFGTTAVYGLGMLLHGLWNVADGLIEGFREYTDIRNNPLNDYQSNQFMHRRGRTVNTALCACYFVLALTCLIFGQTFPQIATVLCPIIAGVGLAAAFYLIYTYTTGDILEKYGKACVADLVSALGLIAAFIPVIPFYFATLQGETLAVAYTEYVPLFVGICVAFQAIAWAFDLMSAVNEEKVYRIFSRGVVTMDNKWRLRVFLRGLLCFVCAGGSIALFLAPNASAWLVPVGCILVCVSVIGTAVLGFTDRNKPVYLPPYV